MVVKQSPKTKGKLPAPEAKRSGIKRDAEKAVSDRTKSEKVSANKSSNVAGWIQDVSLEAPVNGFGFVAKPGEREVEFSVAMRQRSEGDQSYAELRGRALIHAGGNVLALAEASYVTEIKAQVAEPEMVAGMYPHLRDALQALLQLAGHTPPLPATLERAAS